MADYSGLPRIKQGNAPIHVAVPNTATIFNTLAMVLRMYHSALYLTNAFFHILLVTKSLRSACLHVGRQKWTFRVLPNVAYTAPHMSWDSSQRPVLLPHVSKMGPLH